MSNYLTETWMMKELGLDVLKEMSNNRVWKYPKPGSLHTICEKCNEKVYFANYDWILKWNSKIVGYVVIDWKKKYEKDN